MVQTHLPIMEMWCKSAGYARTRWEERREKVSCMDKVKIEIYKAICKIDSQWEFSVLLGELKQGLWDRMKGGMRREMGGRLGVRDMGVPMEDFCWCMTENQKIL